ncbi:MAG: hypothetical protein ACRDRW_05140 [Pseudonocardiaceae bacterium]
MGAGGGQPHTLAQFARRAGISEGRARALYAAQPSGLPKPDRTDAGGRPLWWAATIGSWCASTGRAVQDEALWIYREPAAQTPAVELQRGMVPFAGRRGEALRLYTIAWGTPHGHVVYLTPLDGTDGHPDWLAVHAARLVEPRWWPSALVIVPRTQFLDSTDQEPIADVYRLTTEQAERTGDTMSPFAGPRRWWDRTVDATQDEAGEARPRPELETTWVTQLELSEIARALGTRIPLWIAGTCTEEAAAHTLAYDHTFIVPDTTTGWSDIQQRVQLTLGSELPTRYPPHP